MAATAPSQDQAAIGLLVNQIGSANWRQWQVVRYTFWDYAQFTATGALTTAINLFSIPLGNQDPVSAAAKTLEDTNMIQAGQFGQNYFVIQQIRTHLYLLPKARQNATVAATTTYSYDQEVVSAQIRAVMQTGVLNVTIGQKAYFDFQQPFRNNPPGFGLSNVIVPYDFVTANAAGRQCNAYVAQSASLADVYNLTPPQLIEPAQIFTMQLNFPDLGYNWHNVLDAAAQNANVKVGVILDGYLARPMQ
jgi:hypothetical protein